MSRKKRILIILDYYLPSFKAGGPVKSISNLVEQLEDYDFFIVTRDHDLGSDITFNNVLINNWKLFAYLVRESFQTKKNRMKLLKTFYPAAKDSDWSLKLAGQRVQIIKPNSLIKGKLEFGTEVIISKNKNLATN